MAKFWIALSYLLIKDAMSHSHFSITRRLFLKVFHKIVKFSSWLKFWRQKNLRVCRVEESIEPDLTLKWVMQRFYWLYYFDFDYKIKDPQEKLILKN